MVGMQLECSTVDFASRFRVQDTYKHLISDFSTNSNGTFVSGLQIKYEIGSRITGINWIF